MNTVQHSRTTACTIQNDGTKFRNTVPYKETWCIIKHSTEYRTKAQNTAIQHITTTKTTQNKYIIRLGQSGMGYKHT